MIIIQKIEELFRRAKTQRIDSPQEIVEPISKEKSNSDDTFSFIKKIENIELTNEQKLSEVLKTIGLDEALIRKLVNMKNIDINRLRKNLYLLNQYNYSYIQLSIIIANNTSIITMSPERLGNILGDLLSYFKEPEIVKEIVYSDSRVVSGAILYRIKEVEKIFEKFEVELQENKCILIENPHILFMDDERLEKSLSIIKEYTQAYDSFMNLIKVDPIVIGIVDSSVLTDYM